MTRPGDRDAVRGGPALSAAARVRRAGEREAGHLRRPVRGVLGARGPRARHVVRAVHVAARVGAAVREVVRRREDQRRLQLPRPPRRGRARRSRRVLLRGRACRRARGDHLPAAARRGRSRGERAEGARRRKGHAGRHLHGDGAGPSGRDARVRAARRAAHGRLRRLLGRVARRPAQRHALRGAAHAGRELPARDDRSAEAERRRGARVVPGRAHRRRRPAHARRRADDAGPRHHVERARRGPVDGSRVVPVRADGLGGSPLPPLHERDDREAEGHRAHDGRLPRRRRRRRTTTSST